MIMHLTQNDPKVQNESAVTGQEDTHEKIARALILRMSQIERERPLKPPHNQWKKMVTRLWDFFQRLASFLA